MRTKLVIVATLLLLRAAYADDPSEAQIIQLLHKGRELLDSEQRISSGPLAMEADVDVMLNNSGSAWRAEQQEYHGQIVSMLDRYRNLNPVERDSVNSLLRSSIMSANALIAMTLCNKQEAVWEMDIASQLMDHVQAESVSRTVSEWHADLTKDPKLAGGCK